jgi:hypothetical protein
VNIAALRKSRRKRQRRCKAFDSFAVQRRDREATVFFISTIPDGPRV